jgi:hypothetical protein
MVKNPGITDQNVEVAELFQRFFGHSVHFGKTPDIGANPQSATPEGFYFFDHRSDFLFVAPVDNYVCSFAGKQQSGCPANA